MWALLGRYLTREIAKAGGKRLVKDAGGTIFKRIGARQLRRALLSEGYGIGDALVDTTSATSAILQRIAVSNYGKALRDQALSRAPGLGTNIARRKTQVQVQRAILKDRIYSADHLLSPVVRAYMNPRNRQQEFFQGAVKGLRDQAIATQLFNTINLYSELNAPAWATQYVQNLDELYLPTSSANTKFSRTELAVRAFDVATVRKSEYGNYERLNRIELLQNVNEMRKGNISPSILFSSIFTPQGLGRVAGSFATRAILLGTGQDERNQQNYARSAQRAAEKDGRIFVSGYIRDGAWVNGYWRERPEP